MTAIALGVSVSTQPRTTPIRVFFVFWVCYCIGISTVLQACLTSFLIDTGYEEPFKTVDQMLNSETKFGFTRYFEKYFNLAALTNALLCLDQVTCVEWASKYQSISVIMDSNIKDALKSVGYLTDVNKRPLLCDLEDGIVATDDIVMATLKGHPLLEYINDAINHIVEVGLPIQWEKCLLDRIRRLSSTNVSYTVADTYVDIKVTHLQSTFYTLLLGYILAFVSFILEIIRCNIMSEKIYLTKISASHGAT
jgi:hypothetical protein